MEKDQKAKEKTVLPVQSLGSSGLAPRCCMPSINLVSEISSAVRVATSEAGK